MKILMSHYSIIGRGGYNRTFMLAKELSKCGNTVTLLTSQKSRYNLKVKKRLIDQVLLVESPCVFKKLCSLGLDPINIIFRIIFSLRNTYDLVHSDSGHRPAAGLPCHFHKVLNSTCHIGEWWDYFGKGGQYENKPILWKLTYGRIDNWLELQSKKKCDGIVALSSYTMKRAISIGIPKNRIAVIGGGSDIQNLRYTPNTSIRKKYNIGEDKLIFAFTGSNKTEIKDIYPFIKTLSYFKNQVALVTTGDEILCKSFPHIKESIYEFGWLSYREYTKVLSCADFFLLIQEENLKNLARWPNKIGDYFGSGRLIMANPWGDIELLMKKYPASFIPVNWNSESIKNAIVALLKNKPASFSMGSINHDIAIKELNWENRASELLKFYKYIKGL